MQSKAGFGILEVLIAASLVVLAAMAGVAYVQRGTQELDWTRDRVFAQQRAQSILAELRAYVEGGAGEVAADLDGFDDGLGSNATLSIAPDPLDPGAYIAPAHPVSQNVMDRGSWRWSRQIAVRRFPGLDTRDLRVCTVRVLRNQPGQVGDGEKMAEISSVIRTIGDAYPTTQVYDVYLLAIENVPGWWVYMDAIRPFIEATLSDLESRNPGLEFRAHWITSLGYGRDEEYAPYVNEKRDSQANTPWTYVYPGAMPAGEASARYYVAERMRARMNVDGEFTPTFTGGHAVQEAFTDANGNGVRDPGELYVDTNANGVFDLGNPVPYALCDMQNHCMRSPDASARFDARVAAGLEDASAPTFRLLLDRMISDPERFHNAIFINLHGELLPMPPARNYSDAAAQPELREGWRVVTHPERIRPQRTAGSDALSDELALRVHAFKTSFPSGHESLMTQAEPYLDVNKDGVYTAGETFQDYNGNGVRDAGIPLALRIAAGDLTAAINGATPTLSVTRLSGGIDADGNGSPDPYVAMAPAPRYPELFVDANMDGIRQVVEAWLDLDGDGTHSAGEPHQELDGDGVHSGVTETLTDVNGNGQFDAARPAEPFTDSNGNLRWDAAEPYWDRNADGVRNGPGNPTPPAWVAWNPSDFGNTLLEDAYVFNYGEPFNDLDGDQRWDDAEIWFDANQNGVQDGGFARGEMWFEARYDSSQNATLLLLHGTPLETPAVGSQGLSAAWRLYDLEYVPCPTPDTSAAGGNRFHRDLAWSGDAPKNTARWRISISPAALRASLESSAGALDGDQEDRVLAIETRIGTDLDTGTMWPTRHEPQNLSRTYAWFADSPEDLPFSERYQFNGDPRHSPYADTDRHGSTFANGYNWYFDDLRNSSIDVRTNWLAIDGARIRERWLGRGAHDVPRLMQWLRTALVKNEALYTTLTGFSYYYLSLGGDVGYDSANGYPNSIPMDGTPFGLATDVNENTITAGTGTASIRGSLKLVRSADGADASLRSGGHWWSKPWLGEIFDDRSYASQWVPWGNLRAGTASTLGTYRLIPRAQSPLAQQPQGTTLVNATARTHAEGCTSLFNVGTSTSTFHHQYQDGRNGTLVEDGPELQESYNFPVPTTAAISRPFGLATGSAGGVGDEFAYTGAYPRHSAEIVRRYFNHEMGQIGSALVRLQEPGANPRSAFIVVNGIDRTTESGSAFISRYSLLTLIHSYFAGGLPGTQSRIQQLPRVQITSPTLVTEIDNPSSLDVRWTVEWKRWNGRSYTLNYLDTFQESELDLVYKPLYSRDNGKSWQHMMDDTPAQVGTLPWIEGVGPDPAKTTSDVAQDGEGAYTWSTPGASFPEGSYLIRIEAFRRSEGQHYSQHMEKIHVNR